MNILSYAAAFLAGAGSPIQAGASAQLNKGLASPVWAALFVYVSGLNGGDDNAAGRPYSFPRDTNERRRDPVVGLVGRVAKYWSDRHGSHAGAKVGIRTLYGTDTYSFTAYLHRARPF
jgi:hypothetical protein